MIEVPFRRIGGNCPILRFGDRKRPIGHPVECSLDRWRLILDAESVRRTTEEKVPRGAVRSGAPARRVRSMPGSPVERLAAIQRSAGNAAVVRFLKDIPAGGQPRVVQRAPTDDSDPVVAEQYRAMMLGSRTFEDLDSQVTAQGGPIHLGQDQRSFYEADRHGQRIAVRPGEAREMRFHLLFELHNAMSRDHFRGLRRQHRDEGSDGQHRAEYRTAAHALGKEWLEWVNAVEVNARSEKIDKSLGGVDGSQTLLAFARLFDTPGAKWFNFADYLADQRTGRHTQRYDRAAGKPDWKGLVLLDLARKRNPAALQVTRSEYWAFLVGLRRRTNKPVKDRSENPFQERDLVLLAAAQDKPLPPVPEPGPGPGPGPGPESNPEPEPALDLNEALMQAAGESARRRRRPIG